MTKLLLSGQVPNFVHGSVFGASLCALQKKVGGVHPITVGCVFRRLAGRIAAKHATSLTCSLLRPVQLGVGVPQGCEAVVHACREYVSVCSADNTVDRVLVKVDMRNAFNSAGTFCLGKLGTAALIFFPLFGKLTGTHLPSILVIS